MFSTMPKYMGFVLNPYDPWIANCMIDGKQCTVVWFAYDDKISHRPRGISMIIDFWRNILER